MTTRLADRLKWRDHAFIESDDDGSVVVARYLPDMNAAEKVAAAGARILINRMLDSGRSCVLGIRLSGRLI